MKPIKVLSHKVAVNLIKRMSETEDREAQLDTQVKEASVTIMADNGRRKALTGILVGIVHEIAHEMDYCTGHQTFCDDNDAMREAKERALDALCEAAVQILLDNKLLNEEWVQSLKDEINKVWRNDRN